MPRFDGTGPLGTGPIGRGMGPCGGGLARGGWGRGFFRGNPGWGVGPYAAPIPETKESLEQRRVWLENQVNAINQQLKDMETK